MSGDETSEAVKPAAEATEETTVEKGAEEAVAIIVDDAGEGSSAGAAVAAEKEALKETAADDAKKPAKGDKKGDKGLKGKGKAAAVKPVDLPEDVSDPSGSDGSGSGVESDVSEEVVSPRDRKGKSTKRSKEKEKERAARKNKDRVAKAKSNKKGKAKAKVNVDPSGFDPDDSDQEASEVPGLDIYGNPLRDRFETKAEQALVASRRPQLSVDWRGGKPRSTTSSAQRRSAYIQQIGIVAPAGYECDCCVRRLGPFASCQVAIVDGQLQFAGACANCSWGGDPGRCSFRSGALPRHIYTPLLAANPGDLALLRGCAEDGATDDNDQKVSKRGTPLTKRRGVTKDEPERIGKRARATEKEPVRAGKRARVAEPKEVDPKGKKKATPTKSKGVPRGPDYNTTIFVSVLRDPCVRERNWSEVRSLLREVSDVAVRADWEASVLKAILVKNKEPELSEESDHEVDDDSDVSVFRDLDI
ncbi:hypothetical protein N7451_001260 [Penicillium sp. IBT 35674x]|nr:hypothetical protein N7451_009777 [Penicillium sp. IBT 35674x]KAJ5998262.1 hypothetical protein N7451_006072 [Penicillium sp. IBT 35674x]KAJ6006959.1 hypothetical protein N7451_004903 [Penicillium sp. IBT 35674x]KAJ6017754.1 hypothetical protein N7451_001133 [Penicillium sp. IBT 35674x]KAJ6017881.1 hypothetical protein N7451_001260 [Penicillium sp. IBT 35674x]